MEFSEIVKGRQSVKRFDPDHQISETVLREIFDDVLLSPSSFNLQHWRFVAVTDSELKKQICAASWNQMQVQECSVCIVIVGKLDAHQRAAETLKNEPEQVRNIFLPMIEQFYNGKDQLIRDEAIRSGSLAAMTLMYAAKNKGYDSCPMIGFDPVKVGQIIGLSESDLPVMMVPIGKAVGEIRARSTRLPFEKCVFFNHMEGSAA